MVDLYRRTPVERDALANLIRAGFLDGLHPRRDRAALLAETGALPKKRRRGKQQELPLPHPASWWESREGRAAVASLPPPLTEVERRESRVLGLDLRRHPLSAHREALGSLGVVPGRELRELPHGARARAAGVLETLQAPPTRSGALVHFLLTEDASGLLQSTIFERSYLRFGHILYGSSTYLLEGRVEQDRRRGFSFVVDRIEDLAAVLEKSSGRADAPPAFGAARKTG